MPAEPIIGSRLDNRFQIIDSRVQLKSHGMFSRFGKEIVQLFLVNINATGIQAISKK